jgi:hypothetical protein
MTLSAADLTDIVHRFHAASNGAIEFVARFKRDTMFPSLRSAAALHLHNAAAAMTGNSQHASRVARVALIFSNYYRPHPTALGVMFDRGFATSDDPNNGPFQTAVPREGCAVFLGAIAGSRNSPEEIFRQSFYTTVHELGHMFNLIHHSEQSNFMETSPPHSAPLGSAYRFTEADQKWLREADRDPMVWPGGVPFRQRRPADSSDLKEMRPLFGLDLTLAISRHEFAWSEPVELDVCLGRLRGVEQSFTVPDEIDPGYERFKLWILEPSGERRLYRAPLQYCSSSSTH